jgi:CheY-like chemotaxis protein
MTRKTILIVDDDQASLQAMRSVLAEDFDVVLASDGRQALDVFAARPIDLVICDVLMPNMDGIEMLRALRALSATVPVVTISGGGTIGADNYLRATVALGASAKLAKPIRADDLLRVVSAMLHPSATP